MGQKKSGLLGMKSGSMGAAASPGGNGMTGPGQGQAVGQRDGGKPEDVNFETKKLPANELNPGTIAGQLPAEAEAPKGEATLPVHPEPQAALQRMAQKIDSEVLPAEYREEVIKYMELLRGKGGGDAEGSKGEGGGNAPPAPPGGAPSPGTPGEGGSKETQGK